jgi:hypothetical protein
MRFVGQGAAIGVSAAIACTPVGPGDSGDPRSAPAVESGAPSSEPPLESGTARPEPGMESGTPSDSAFDSGGRPLLDLPFSYSVTASGVVIHTDGGDVYASMGPWGSHFLPNAGHMFGDAKSNIAAFFTPDLSSLTDVDGSSCNVGDSCDLPLQAFAAKIPMYVAPLAGTLDAVEQDATPKAPIYYPNNLKYSLRMRAGGYDFLIGHLGSIAPGLRDKILTVTCARGACEDIATWNEFGSGSAKALAIPVAAGEALGRPNVAAIPSSRPGYYRGEGLFWIPWIQMEFFVSIAGETICYFDLMDPAIKDALQKTIDGDMASRDSVRYGPSWFQAARWQWAAEGRACNAHSVFPMDYSSLRTNLGGWWKLPPPGGTAEEVLAFVPIAKDTPSYDENLYSTKSVDSLILRTRPPGGMLLYDFTLPDGGILSVERLNGEVVEQTATALLVRWRDVRRDQLSADLFQRAAFALGTSGLMMRWGDAALTIDEASVPVLDAGDTCSLPGIDCYDHTPSGVY